MKKQVLLRFSKLEDVRRENMYRDYLLLLSKKKDSQGKIGDARPNRLALK